MIPQLILAALLAADVSGVWSGDLAPSVSLTLTLQQNGDSVSGTEQVADRVFPIENGQLNKDRLTFTFPIPFAGRLRHTPVVAVLQNDELRIRDTGTEVILRRVDPKPEEARVERLATTIRLWGAIRFFHPYVAYRRVDWDTALITAVQQVDKAVTKADLALALSKMLKSLDDSETRVLGPDERDPLSIPCRCRAIIRSGFFNNAPSASAPYYVDWEDVGQSAPYVMGFSNGIRVAIRTAEPVGASNSDIRTSDNPFGEDLPSREYRLLALARYWNTIHYFYGYPDSLESWDSALTEFIPQFEQAQTRRDYLSAIARLASRTHDGHSYLGTGTGTVLAEFGNTSNVGLQNIGGQIVVTATAVAALQRGDVIRTVNRIPVLDREKFLLGLLPHSTPWWGQLAADRYLLAGPEPLVSMGIQRTGAREIELKRDVQFASVRPAPVSPEVFARLPSGLAYIDLTRLQRTDVDRAFDSLMDAPGLILDLRGSPSNIFPLVAARLTDVPVAAALIRRRVWHGPDPAAVIIDTSVQYAYPSGKTVYRGSVAVLIDAHAFSQAEHTCLYLEAATKVTFVGTPTAGTDGEVTSMVLPGTIQANFGAMNVSHADGRPLQRVGILPDVWVEPTLKGIQEGRDEILERAVDVLTRR